MYEYGDELVNIDEYFLSEFKNDNIAEKLFDKDRGSQSVKSLKKKVEEIIAVAN